MGATGAATRTQDLAQSLSELTTQLYQIAPRGRHRRGGLKEIEFLTLSLLQRHETLIVGDIQRQLRVLPAQMSRIIRSLGGRGRPLIACRINPHDKRKIDVTLTEEGLAAFQEYQQARLSDIMTIFSRLSEEDFDNLQRLIAKLQDAMSALRS
jgi:DNA-binding MarR family transcriptional regulator